MRQKLKEDAENGRTFSLRDIIAMKDDYLDDKSISPELGSRFKRPIPHVSRYTNITPAKNHWLPKTTARTTTLVTRPTKSSLNLMDLMARRRQQQATLVTTARMRMTTTAPPAVRIQNAYAAQKSRVLQGLGRSGIKETTTDRFRTRVVPFTTAPPRTYRTRHVPFGQTTRPLIKATILTTTARPRITRQVSVLVPTVMTATVTSKTTMHPVRAAFLRKLQMKPPVTTPVTTITTTVPVEINTKDARQNFLEKLQAMKIGRTNAPAPETMKSTTQLPAASEGDGPIPNSSRFEFFKKLKEQMMESNSTSLAKEIETKRQFFMRMMQNKVKTTDMTTTKMSNNRRVELEAINMAKAGLMSKVKPTVSSSRLAFMQQLKEKKLEATKTTTQLTLTRPTTTKTTTAMTQRPLTRDAASKARMEYLKRLQAQKSTLVQTDKPILTQNTQVNSIEQMRQKTTKKTTTKILTTTSTSLSSSTTLSARMAFLRQLQKSKPETTKIVTTTITLVSTPNAARLAFMQRLKGLHASVAPSTTIEPPVDAPYTISSSRLAFLKRLKDQRSSLAKATTTAAPMSAKLKVALTSAPKSIVSTFAPFQTQAPTNDNSDPQLKSILCKLTFHSKCQNSYFLPSVNTDGSKKTSINWKAFKARKDQLTKLRAVDQTRRKMWQSQKQVFDEQNRVKVQELLVKHQFTDETRPRATQQTTTTNAASLSRLAFLQKLKSQREATPTTKSTMTSTTQFKIAPDSRLAFLQKLKSQREAVPSTPSTIMTKAAATVANIQTQTVFLNPLKRTTKVATATSPLVATTSRTTTKPALKNHVFVKSDLMANNSSPKSAPINNKKFLANLMKQKPTPLPPASPLLTKNTTPSASKMAFLKRMMAKKHDTAEVVTKSTDTSTLSPSKKQFIMQMLAKKRATQTSAPTAAIALTATTPSPIEKKAMFQKMMDMKRQAPSASSSPPPSPPRVPPPPASDIAAAKKKFLMEMMAKKRAMASE